MALAAVGAAAFVYGLLMGDSIRAWQALLVNFLFFAGLAQAGVALSATLQTTSARWGRPLKRMSEATGAFLPVAFGLLLILLLGVSSWAPWVHEPIAAKTPWLNIPFLRRSPNPGVPAAQWTECRVPLSLAATRHWDARRER